MPDRMLRAGGTDKSAGSGLGGGGSYNKINQNLAEEQRFLLCSSMILGHHSCRKFLRPFRFFLVEKVRGGLVPFSCIFCQEGLATRAATYCSNKHVLCSQKWQIWRINAATQGNPWYGRNPFLSSGFSRFLQWVGSSLGAQTLSPVCSEHQTSQAQTESKEKMWVAENISNPKNAQVRHKKGQFYG